MGHSTLIFLKPMSLTRIRNENNESSCIDGPERVMFALYARSEHFQFKVIVNRTLNSNNYYSSLAYGIM